MEARAPRIASWASERDAFQMVDPDEVVIDKDVKVEFDYPLSQSFEFDLPGPVTRMQLADFICATYQRIYEEENAATKPSTVEERQQRGGLLNREQTNGPYGIWGHDIGDLWLEGIVYHPEVALVTLSIGS